MDGTIFALASARGRSGVAVIRISGSQAHAAGEALCGKLPTARHAAVRRLREAGRELDEALVLSFDRGGSFTGEPVVEFHVHGSTAVVSEVLAALGRMPGLRMAEPGEFTRRALENGRLDLAQVEGLADLIDAETEAQRVQALRVMSGALGRRADGWRAALLRMLALVETMIDFSDEDIPADIWPPVRQQLLELHSEFAREIAGSTAAERIREGFEVAIVGSPNVGKSTLLNALAGREAALTSAVAGTTRDVVEVRMDIAGLPVTLLDTAGLRETSDEVEQLGVQRARDRAAAADLRILVVLPGEPYPDLVVAQDDLVVCGKADLYPSAGLSVSGTTGAGLDALVARVGSVLSARTAGAGVAIRQRHRHALESAVRALDGAKREMDGARRHEVVAEDLRDALRAMDSLVGKVDVEHILGEIFSSFCIGK